jgi:hypothetical protein
LPSNVVNDTYHKLKLVPATKEVQEAIHLQGMEIVGTDASSSGPAQRWIDRPISRAKEIDA